MTKRQRWTVVREAGDSGASLALRLGMSKQTVCRHLNGTQYSHETAELIAAHVGLTVSAMWPKQSRRAA
jgi:lambda repressor-like predicted transcriptional regulator